MNLRKHLFLGLRTAFATVAILFGLQLWYSSYLDVAVIHGGHGAVAMDPQLQAVRQAEQARLSAGPMPIGQAMAALAQRGRSAFPQLSPQPSSDLSAMSGWIHKPGFQAYVPRAAAKP